MKFLNVIENKFKDIVKNKNKRIVFIIFISFFILLLIQHSFVFLYNDDYGYASLSYLTKFNLETDGYHTNMGQIFNFLGYHYLNWGGRIICFFFECTMLSLGLWPIRILQSIIIALIFYLIYKIITKLIKNDNWKIALFTVLCYGIIEVMYFRNAIFWFSASTAYIWPLLPFLLFVYLNMIEVKGKKLIFKYIFELILVFLATFSQEQISVMVLSYIGMNFLFNLFKNKKINFFEIGYGIVGTIGFGILMLAPRKWY